MKKKNIVPEAVACTSLLALTHEAKTWFKPRTTGWGYTPAKWQGWAVLGGAALGFLTTVALVKRVVAPIEYCEHNCRCEAEVAAEEAKNESQ